MKTTDLHCNNCGRMLGRRREDTLVAAGFTIDFKRTTMLDCECGGRTAFKVDRTPQGNGFKKQVATTGGMKYSSK